MAKVTLIFAVLLAGLGLGGFLGTGSIHPTALIPVWFGVALGLFGFLAISPNEGRRKLFMHINVTIGLLGFLGTFAEIYRSLKSGNPVDLTALAEKLGLAWLLLIYVILCVRSFVSARTEAVVALRAKAKEE
jgi:pilus assembly protein TadC